MFERLHEDKPSGDPAKLVAGLLSADPKLLTEAEAALGELFGRVSARSEQIAFNFTDYYQPEMGPGLVRQWVGFFGLVEPDVLADLKIKTRQLEKRFRGPDNKRRVNLDPGVLTLHNLVLASTKGFAHRIYLRDGIFAELELIFQSGKFQPLAWTYPDYQTPACQEFLMRCRKELLADAAQQRISHDNPFIKAT